MKSVAALAIVVLLAGCTATPPVEFTDSDPQVSCGSFDLGLMETLPDDAADCLHDAAGTAAAELVMTRLTEEGDPVTSYFHTSADRERITVYVDATQDSFGSKKWMTLQCPADVDPMRMTGCTE